MDNIDKLEELLGKIKTVSEIEKVQFIPTGLVKLDNKVLYGGLPRSRYVEIHSRESSGKCLSKDTYLMTDLGLETVEEIFKRNNTECFISQNNTPALNTNFFNKDGIIENCHTLIRNNKRNQFKIKTDAGYEIQGTSTHKVKIIDDYGQIIWRDLGKIKLGDNIVFNRKYSQIKVDEKIDELEARFLGYIIADGSLSEIKRIRFTNSDISILEDYRKCVQHVCKKLGVSDELKEYTKKSKNVEIFEIDIKRLITIQTIRKKYSLGAHLSKDKEIPYIVRTSGNRILKEYLSAYFDCDGYINLEKRDISVITASEEMSKQVQLSLLLLGIACRRKEKTIKHYEDRHYFNIEIHTNNFLDFLNLFEFKSNINSIKVLKNPHKKLIYENVIPNIENKFISLINNYSGCGINESLTKIENRKTQVTTELLKKSLSYIKSTTDDWKEDYNFLYLEFLCNSFFYYSKVDDILFIEDVPSFDFSMEKSKSYIANGMINHNSSLALFLVAMVQKQGGRCIWFESEGTLTKEYAEQCGVDVSTLEIVNDFTTGQDCLFKIKQRLALNIYDLIVLDSNTKLIPENLMESKAEKNSMHDNMQLAKMNTEFFRSLAGYEIRDKNNNLIKSNKKYYHGTQIKDTWHKLSDKKACLIFIMHAMDDIGSPAPGAIKSTGGAGSKFEATIRLTLKLRGTKKDSNGNLLYKKIDVIAVKNKLGAPYGYTTLLLHSDGTVEEENSDEALIDIGLEKEIFKHSGAWYFYNEIKFQGKNSLIEYINQNPELKEEITRG